MQRVILPEDDGALLALAGLSELPPPGEGLFRNDGWLRRVSSESALLFGGGRALLLEVAHPLVAAGVAEHSSFRTDPFGRLQRTLDAMTKLTFGDLPTALGAARSVERSHRRVRGVLREAVGPFPAGTPYDGRDPELVRWVWATLVDTSLLVYELFASALAPEAREAYYAGQRVLARLLGVPAEGVPPTLAEFRAWFDGMLASEALSVGPQGRDIAVAVLDPPGGMADAATVRLLTTALLPPRLREAFALPWEASHERRFEALCASVRRLRDEAARPGGVAGAGSVS
jgi:uncharacterized protein (DUF2236 family)